jgi:hypothetical protein
MSHKRHRRQPPPVESDELKRTLIVATAQGLIREALVIILREIWRGGPWL